MPPRSRGPFLPTARGAARSEIEFRRLLDKLPAGAYMCDADGLITYFNQHAIRVWGREPLLNDAADRFCGSFKLFAADGTPLQHDQCWMARALREQREYNGCEIVVERPNGSRVNALAHANPIHDETGALLGAVNVLVDITDRKQSELALQSVKDELAASVGELQESARLKDEFLATLAHELRNPLAPLRNSLHILRLSGELTPAGERIHEMMERQVNHLVRLVDDLMEVSRISRGRIELRKDRIALAAIVRHAVETSRPLIDAAGHQLAISLPTEVVMIDGDEVRLAQVLSNLLNNAARYTEPGGQIWLNARQAGSHVMISVRDTGKGISASVLPRIFDMFMQVDPAWSQSQGLGIGLTLVKRLTEMHGGRVEAKSAGPGHGSEFLVHLPLAEVLSAQTLFPGSADAAPSPLDRRRILVVDDNRDAADSLAMLLRCLGADVSIAYSGAASLEMLETLRPTIILLDLGMPELDGYDVARQIRQHPVHTKVRLIALTGRDQEADRRRTLEAGFDNHLVKPVDPEALETLLASDDSSQAADRVLR